MMKNEIEINGSTATVLLRRRDGTQLRAIIDSEDLPKILSTGLRWTSLYNRHTKSFYARAGRIRMHRLICNAPLGKEVDHLNHNTLDNRKSNLRVVSGTSNQLNRIRANKDNISSGIRGVHWDANSGKWKARLKRHGISHHLGLFLDMTKAAEAVSVCLSRWGEPVHAVQQRVDTFGMTPS